jgi:hypothetical protein
LLQVGKLLAKDLTLSDFNVIVSAIKPAKRANSIVEIKRLVGVVSIVELLGRLSPSLP